MAFGPFRGLPGVEAQSAMGHAHLVFLIPVGSGGQALGTERHLLFTERYTITTVRRETF
jgi:hypothetical protein